MNNNMKLPTNCEMMNDDEMMNVSGGNALETAFKVVVAVGGAGILLCVAGVAAKGILSIFNPNGLDGAISDSVNAGSNFIQGALDAGQDLLDGLMGK